jgi:hypothetical protein
MAEMQPCAEETPKEEQIVKFVAQIDKPILSSEDAVSKRFDVVTDCLDHHFVKENGHESVMQLLKLSLTFFSNNNHWCERGIMCNDDYFLFLGYKRLAEEGATGMEHPAK